MLSFWEQNSFQSFDVVIIGAGISGLSTAASLKEKDNRLNILVVERGTLPTGASTKNAGFACFGSVSELVGDRLALGDDGMTKLVHRRWQGLQKTIQRLGEERIGLLKKGGYELIHEGASFKEDQMEEINQLLHPIFRDQVFSKNNRALSRFKFGKTKELIYNQFEAQLDTGAMMRSLWAYCSQLGIHIITGTEVLQFQPSGNGIEIETQNMVFKARSMAVCTNAFTNRLVSDDLDLQPGRGMVMMVEPEKPTEISGTFHYDEGYYYFRDYHGKLIFGGGRNLAIEDEATDAFGINQKIYARLEGDLQEIILPNQRFEIKQTWSGIMAFGADKSPIVKKISDRSYLGVRLGGMGVALGSMVGEELSDLILSDGF
ncbi:MAG: FAD-binding oxidoreductase [Cyclobacteriaceae bacterium]